MPADLAMLWLGVCLPHLPIEVFLRGTEAPASTVEDSTNAPRDTGTASPSERPPLAVVDHGRVLLACPQAQAAGVHPGTKRATALALSPTLRLVERDAAREDEALRQAACWALQFTPSVSLQCALAATRHAPLPGGLLMEVAPSLRLFGGLAPLLSRLRDGLAELGFACTVGCAPFPKAAWMLARVRDGASAETPAQINAQLGAMPIHLLDEALPHLATLESIGVNTLRELALLPRAGLARRFGRELLIGLERAFGRHPDPRPWFDAPEVFEARLELLADVEHAEAMLFGAQRLLAQLAGWLGARQAATRRFELQGEHDGLSPTIVPVRLSAPARETARFVSVLRESLAVLRLPAAVHTLRLRCDDAEPLAARNDELFPMPASAREGLGRLIERLQARLGRHQVQRLLLAADHRPEAAYRLEPVEQFDTPGPAQATAVLTGALPRPLWLLARPAPVAERNDRPFLNGPLALLAGPERIESGWWDGRLVQRDYFIAADETEALLWIYRERLPDTASRQGWFIHGRFG